MTDDAKETTANEDRRLRTTIDDRERANGLVNDEEDDIGERV
ncbi:hypothetical protein BVRB_009760 [Beta vulgaris subsp. vulgaris]|uniref:Uncharacterized protein n=1 Tax=Beta vulgaris subsp. vulgaris TaxID=3555 RepID=A0A0J8B651_BETVV|nr:hypothetical protein BVRB_009760 [Beta vulgaris subsp. vulgaris]